MDNLPVDFHVDALVDEHGKQHEEQDPNLNGGPNEGKSGSENGGLHDIVKSLAVLRAVIDRLAHDSAGEDSAIFLEDIDTPEQLRERLSLMKREIIFLEMDNATLQVLLSEANDEVQEVGHCNDVLAEEKRKLLDEIPQMRAELTRYEKEVCNYKAQIADLQRSLRGAERHAGALAEAAVEGFQEINEASD